MGGVNTCWRSGEGSTGVQSTKIYNYSLYFIWTQHWDGSTVFRICGDEVFDV